jgi:hypothetical protein
MTMTPQAKETLDDILEQFKKGNTSQDAAAFQIEELYKREPVNYKRVYSKLSDTVKGPTLLKGETITLKGFGPAADTSYKILDSSQEVPGASINLEIEPLT